MSTLTESAPKRQKINPEEQLIEPVVEPVESIEDDEGLSTVVIEEEILLKLAKENAHPRDGRVVFQEEGHIYYIDGEASKIRSVTTLAHLGSREFDADAAIAVMKKNPKKWNKDHPMFGLSNDQIKEAWEKNRDEAARLGTLMHLQIELYYNDLPHDDTTKEFKLFQAWKESRPDLTIKRVEFSIFSKDLLICGQIDALFKNENGEYVIADWKRSKQISRSGFCSCPWKPGRTVHEEGCTAFCSHPITKHLPDSNFWQYSIQLNCYRWLLKHFYNITAVELFLVVLHPDQENFIEMPVKIDEKLIDQIMENRARELGLSEPFNFTD